MYRDYSKMLGRRFFKSDKEGNLVVYKVISFATSEKARVINIKDPNTTFKIPYEELLEDYEMLGPDGNIVFNIVKLNDNIEDVIVCLFRNEDLKTGVPYCVARQNIINIYNDFIKKYDHLRCTGMCMSLDSIPEGIDYRMMLACNDVVLQTSIAYYNDDKLEDILRCIKKIDVYDTVMNNLFMDNYKKLDPYLIEADKVDQLQSYGGYNRTLVSFLDMVDFMKDVRKGYGIVTIPYIINVTDDIEMVDEVLLHYLDYELGYKIFNPSITKYDKYIDTDKIIRDYVIICDATESMYIIVYDSE